MTQHLPNDLLGFWLSKSGDGRGEGAVFRRMGNLQWPGGGDPIQQRQTAGRGGWGLTQYVVCGAH